MWRVRRSPGVGTVWRGISASGGKGCLPSLGETRGRAPEPDCTVESVTWGCEGRHKASPYGEYIGLAGRGLAKLFRLGTRYDRDTRSARHVVGEGALRGRSPRTREGRIGPTAQLQWSVVSGQLVSGRLHRRMSDSSNLLSFQTGSEFGSSAGLVIYLLFVWVACFRRVACPGSESSNCDRGCQPIFRPNCGARCAPRVGRAQ